MPYTQVPYGNINSTVYNAYQPTISQASQSIQNQKTQATQDLYSALLKRGMLSSGLLAGGISDISRGTQNAYGDLYSKLAPIMAQQSISLNEGRRAEDEAKKWGIFNLAAKMLSPIAMAPIYGAAYNIGQQFLPKENPNLGQLYSGFAAPNTQLSLGGGGYNPYGVSLFGGGNNG